MSRWKARTWWILGLLCGALLLGAFAVRAFGTRKDIERWEDYQRECQSRGEDLDFEAWLPPEIPDDANFVAHPWMRGLLSSNADPQAIALADWREWRIQELAIYERPKGGESWFQGNLGKAEAVLERGRRGTLDLNGAHAAAARPQCRLSLGFDPDSPNLDDATMEMLRRLAELQEALALRAEAALIANDAPTAVADLEALLRVGNHLRSHNLVLLSMHGSTCETDASKVIQLALKSGQLSSEAKRRLSDAIRTRSLTEELTKAFRVDRGLNLRCMEGIIRASAPNPHRRSWRYQPERLVASNSLSFCQRMDQVLEKDANRADWEAFEKSTWKVTGTDLSTGIAAILLLGTANAIPELFLREDEIEQLRQRLAE
jgi:hypothetical protein